MLRLLHMVTHCDIYMGFYFYLPCFYFLVFLYLRDLTFEIIVAAHMNVLRKIQLKTKLFLLLLLLLLDLQVPLGPLGTSLISRHLLVETIKTETMSL